MKKYFEVRPSFSDLKEKIVVLQDRDEKKTMFIVLAVVAAVLAVVTLGVVYLLKTKMDDEYDEIGTTIGTIWMTNAVTMNAAAQTVM